METIISFDENSILDGPLIGEKSGDNRDNASVKEVAGGFSCDGLSELELSKRHYKFHPQSLKWDYAKGSYLEYRGKNGFKPFVEGSKDKAIDTFAIWIYNEQPVKGNLTFMFKKAELECCFFEFGLNFKGWRTCWVAYERDMNGKPVVGMDSMVIKSPSNISEGTLYINEIILANPVDPRHQASDFQVPFVNKGADNKANHHWMGLGMFSRLKGEALGSVVDGDGIVCALAQDGAEVMESVAVMGDVAAMDNAVVMDKAVERDGVAHFPDMRYGDDDVIRISDRFKKHIVKPVTVDAEKMKMIRNQYKEYSISIIEGTVTGRCITQNHHFAIYPKGVGKKIESDSQCIFVKAYSAMLFEMAQSYHNTDNQEWKNELKEYFCNMVIHLDNQGFSEGSAFGTVHHIGYNLRHLFLGIFLMGEALEEAGLKEKAQGVVDWYSGTGRIFVDFETIKSMSIDTFNTQLQGMLASLLLMGDASEQSACLGRLSQWLSHSLKPFHGVAGPLKIDGSVFHHTSHYPAYAVGGFQGVTPVVYFLSGTAYRIAEESHKCLKNAIMKMRLYCNKYDWLVSLSARHPDGKGKYAHLDIMPFKYLALAGTPDGIFDIDQEVAEAYLRLVKDHDKYTFHEGFYTVDGAHVETGEDAQGEFSRRGFAEEQEPNGHWTMNHAVMSLHRRDGWLVGARGHSRYIWANETYVSANLYGRYITHGHVQIMNNGDPVNNEDSGYVKTGYDWNHWPGTTVIKLPIEALRSDVRNVDDLSGFEEMLLSDETYAGGLSIEGQNGMFAMKLHEHPKYNGTHRANKSVFFFDNRIVLLGSDIENGNDENTTVTTLFQNHIGDNDKLISRDGGFGYTKVEKMESGQYLLDNKGNGYYIPQNQKLVVTEKIQESRDHETEESIEGKFATAWIDHGKSPDGASYEYALLVGVDEDAVKSFSEKMEIGDEVPYKVLQKDKFAHVVKDAKTQTTGYAIFDSENAVEKEHVHWVNMPSMIMTKFAEGQMTLSVCDPDLRLYDGVEEDQYDGDGNRIEVSLYSRKWRMAEGKASQLTVALNGYWMLESEDMNYGEESHGECKSIMRVDGITIVEFTCKHAMPIEIKLNEVRNDR